MIGATQSNSDILSLQQTVNNAGTNSQTQGTTKHHHHHAHGADSAQFSAMGSLMQGLSSMSPEDQQAVKDFMHNVRQSLRSGTFDAAKMADQAPDALKSYAAANGIDLQSALSDLASKVNRMKAMRASNGQGNDGDADDGVTGQQNAGQSAATTVQSILQGLVSAMQTTGTNGAQNAGQSTVSTIQSILQGWVSNLQGTNGLNSAQNAGQPSGTAGLASDLDSDNGVNNPLNTDQTTGTTAETTTSGTGQ